MSNNLNFYNLQNQIFFTKKIEAHYHYWTQNSSWKSFENGRINHAFMFFISCSNTYYTDGKKILTAKPGDIVYLPKGARYECHFETNSDENGIPIVGETPNYYFNGSFPAIDKSSKFYNAIYIAFDIFNEEFKETQFSDKITILPIENNENIFFKFDDIVSLSRRGLTSNLMLNISFAKLLLEINKNLTIKSDGSINPVLEPAFKFIANHDINEITIPQLASACRLSLSGFRALFKAQTGIPPIDYLIDLKIKKARVLLADSNLSVSQVAHMLGFDDLSYFTKFYKQHTGKTPSKDRN